MEEKDRLLYDKNMEEVHPTLIACIRKNYEKKRQNYATKILCAYPVDDYFLPCELLSN